MLERVPTCIESGGRLLRASKRGVTSKRRLHCGFWHHGAGDLNSPAGWASLAASISLARCPPEDSSSPHALGAATSNQSSSPFMDFLYPPHTKAFMQKISRVGWDGWKPNTTRASQPFRARLYSSLSKDTEESTSVPGVEQTSTDEPSLQANLERYHRSDPKGAMKYILVSELPKDYSVAWQVYRQLSDVDINDSLKADLMDYMSTSSRTEDISHVLALFESLSPHRRRSSAYRAAIVTHLKLRTIGKAIEIHKEAAECADSASFGTDILLARLFFDKQWDLAFQTYEAYEAHMRNTSSEPVNVFTLVAQLPDFLPRFFHFFSHMTLLSRKFEKEGKTPVSTACLRGLTEALLPRITHWRKLHNPYWKRFFRRVRTAGLSKRSYYENAIKTLLGWGKYNKKLNYDSLPWSLYHAYTREAMNATAEEDLVPSKEFFHHVFSVFHQYHEKPDAWIKLTTDDTMIILPGITFSRLTDDWKHFYGDLPKEWLRTLMRVYAVRGRAEQVFSYFEELCSQGVKPEVGDMVPLIQVYARRASPKDAQRQFDRMKGDFDLYPNTYCWSVLIDAYARADDLPGALRCLHALMATGLKVPAEAFGPILNLMAIRGDVTGVYDLLEEASLNKVDTNTVKLRFCAIVAHLNDGNLPAAENELLEFTNKALQELTPRHSRKFLTPIWNPILVHHALEGNFASMARVYQKMNEHRIPFDTWTYAAIIRGLCVVRESEGAWKIIRVIMPQKRIRPLAFHYSLVMRGFMHQDRPERSLEVYKWMQMNGVSETYTSRQVHIEARLALERKMAAGREITQSWLPHKRGDMDRDGKPLWMPPRKKVEDPLHEYQVARSMDPAERLDLLVKDIKALMGLSDPAEYSAKQPRAFGVTQMNQALPETFFQALIMSYGMQRSYELAVDLFDSFLVKEDPAAEPHFEASVRLLRVLLQAYSVLEDHDKVERCWRMMRDNAQKLIRKPGDLALPVPETQMDDPAGSQTDGPLYLQDGAEGSTRLLSLFDTIFHVPNAKRRRVLSRPTTAYLRYLMSQERYEDVIMEFVELGIMGYHQNNGTWNCLVEALLHSGRTFVAFKVCENFLMPNFTSWTPRINNPRQGGHSYTYMKTTAAIRNRPSGIRPRYRTLVVLASALMHIRQSDRPRPVGDMSTELTGKMIRDIAPQTVEAVDSMPLVKGDELQREFLDIQ